jgi:uncharacterized protein (UPF0548 family)
LSFALLPSLSKPSDSVLDAFLARERELPFSYPEVGQTRDGLEPSGTVPILREHPRPCDTGVLAPSDALAKQNGTVPLSETVLKPPPLLAYNLDHNRVQIGQGMAAFDAACDALRHWGQFPAPWTEIYPATAPLVAGTVVAMLCRVLGLWWLNSCRIVYTIDEMPVPRPEDMPVPPRPPARHRFGFAYGTLPGHVERGEERFLIECDEREQVWYDLLAFSRPRLWAARLGYPLARHLQRCFVRDSQAAMHAAVAQASATTDRG